MGGTTTTIYVGNYYETTGTTVTKYYYMGGQRVAMRQGSTLYYLHGDHLGSASMVTNGFTTTIHSQMRYYPYGETRWTSGALPTDRRYTGQRWEAGAGLYDYNARFYDPALGRFIQADTVIPDLSNPQSLNRYSYVYNNPLKYTDPSGHCIFGLDTLVCIVAAGAAIGAAVGYGYQVNANLREGMEFRDALTTDIQAGPIVGGAFLGGTAGAVASLVATALGIGATGATVAGGATTLAGGAVQAAGADGDYTNEVEAVGNAGYGALTRAADYGIRSHNALEGAVRGTELQRHHLIEQRFAPVLGQKADQMLSVVVTHEEHVRFTSLWRDAIGYRNSGQVLRTDTATPDAIWKTAQSIYAGYPALLEGARQTLFK